MQSGILRTIVWITTLFFACMLSAHASMLDNLLRDKSDPVVGNPNGSVTIVEFFDYQCSYCGSMVPTIAALLRSNPEVRLVFKDYPIRGPESEYAARAALAANIQGKYLKFNHALFNLSSYNEKSITKLANSMGLDADKLIKDMTSSKVSTQLQNNYNLGDSLKIEGTPTFFIAKTNETNDSKVESIFGEASRAELEGAIKKAEGK